MPSRFWALALSLAAIASAVLFRPVASEEPKQVKELLAQAAAAAQAGDLEKAVGLAGQAIELDPKHLAAWDLRARLHAALDQHEQAVADYGHVLDFDPKLAEAYNRRGAEQFKLGRIEESIADFDKYIELVPSAEPGHWMRGISYYYAGRYDEGRKQFEGYQTVDSNDVENAVWRYLCMARDVGVEKARAAMLKIGRDGRVPMMEVYALYSGKAQPDDVLAAAKAGEPNDDQLNERLFYAHLYLGLYYDAAGDEKRALEHVAQAAEEYKIGHYMWHVARVHLQRLRDADQEYDPFSD